LETSSTSNNLFNGFKRFGAERTVSTNNKGVNGWKIPQRFVCFSLARHVDVGINVCIARMIDEIDEIDGWIGKMNGK